MAYNILRAKHKERGFLFSMKKGKEEMSSHLSLTRESDCESHTARHRCRKYDAKENDQWAEVEVRRVIEPHRSEDSSVER